MSTRTAFFVQVILINIGVCIFWWALILDKPERAEALIVLLPIQVAINFAVIGVTRKMRISGLTLVFILGLLFSLLNMIRTGSGGC